MGIIHDLKVSGAVSITQNHSNNIKGLESDYTNFIKYCGEKDIDFVFGSRALHRLKSEIPKVKLDSNQVVIQKICFLTEKQIFTLSGHPMTIRFSCALPSENIIKKMVKFQMYEENYHADRCILTDEEEIRSLMFLLSSRPKYYTNVIENAVKAFRHFESKVTGSNVIDDISRIQGHQIDELEYQSLTSNFRESGILYKTNVGKDKYLMMGKFFGRADQTGPMKKFTGKMGDDASFNGVYQYLYNDTSFGGSPEFLKKDLYLEQLNKIRPPKK